MENSLSSELLSLYHRAKISLMEDKQVIAEIERARTLNPSNISCNDFIREYAWVVFVSGFKVNTIRRKAPLLERAFKNWDFKTILEHRAEVYREALQILNNKKKIDAIFKVIDFINCQGWDSVKDALLSDIIRNETGVYPSKKLCDYIENNYRRKNFAFMGTANRRYLAKNLGFDLAKNDRHLTRLAEKYGYGKNAEDVQKFVEDISRLVGERVSVVETIIFNASEKGFI